MHIERTAPPPIGIAHLTAINVAPLAFVEMAAAVGYAHVGLRLHPAFAGSPFYKIPVGTSLMRSIRSRLAETGLRVYDVELITIDADLDLETLKPVLETAAELGAQRLSVCGDDPDRGRMVATFARLCELAADHGMGVDLEMMPWRRVDTLEAAQHVVEAAQQANGAILIDALHLSRSGGAPPDLGLIEPSCIRSAHLCDAAANRPATMEALIQEARGGRLIPGNGDLPLHRLLAGLPDCTTLTVEVPNIGLVPEAHAWRVFQAAKRVLAAYAERVSSRAA